MGHGYEISVLHVDDEPDFTDLTAEFIERADDRISVQTATSAADGLKHLSESEIDCIVSDYAMPGQNGIEFLETVRADYPDLPFILFTGEGSEAVASQAISAGVSDYLQKDSGTGQYELLANEIVEFVEKYRTEQELDELRRQFTTVVEQNFVGIYIIQNGEFVYVNPRLAEIHGYDDPAEVIGMSPLDLVVPAERGTVRSNLEQRLSGDVAELQYQTVGLTKGGDRIDIELHGSYIELDGEPAVIGAEADITARKEESRKLEFLESLEKTLTDLSIEFLEVENRDLDALIDGGLAELGTLVGADRSYVFQINHEDETLSNTHEWCAEGIEPQIDMLQNVGLDTFPWLLPQLRNDESVTIPEVAELPPEAEDLQRILTAQNITSLLVAPMISDGTLVGFIGFDWTQEQKSWSREFVDILRMAGELITSARRQEARRRELERYEAYLEHSQDVITEVDEDGTMTYHNPAIERILGIDPADRLGDTIFEYVHPDDRQRLVTQFDEFVTQEAESTSRIEFRYEDADGSYQWIESIGVDQTDTTVGGYVVYSRDITERKEREEKYRNLFEENRDALVVFDRDGHLDCNERALDLFGIDSVDEFLDYSPWGLSPPKQPDGRNSEEAAIAHVETAFQEGEDFFEWTHQRVDGTEFPSEVKLSRFSYSGETVILALIRDITERKDRERELAAAREASQKLIEASPVPIWVQDVEEILYSNDAAAAFFGYEDPESLVGASALAHVPENERDRARNRNENMLETGEAMDELPGRVVTTDGTTRDAVFAAAPITYYGEPAIVTIANDITERKEYQQQIKQQRDDITTLNQVLRHDIRNDLQLVTTYAELLAEECETIKDQIDRDVDQYIETIQQRATHSVELTTTAREMADTMLTDEGGVGAVNLRPILENQLDEVQASYPEAIVTTESAIPSTKVRANNMLGSVFQNLLKNGIQHNDSEVPKVEVSVTESETEVEIRVADNGTGVPDEQKETIFGKGEKGLNSHGSGIGLYLVQTLVTKFGGDVWIEDNDPEGSVFAVALRNAS
jgi:PAS domain S-box-containing protein